MLPHFYYNPRNTEYDFGPQHPLKPERLRRTLRLLDTLTGTELIDPGLGRVEDTLRVHSEEYVEAVRRVDAAATEGSLDDDEILELRSRHGFWGDNPPFPGMFEATLSYTGAVVAAAEAVRDGAPLAFGIGGGLHHAQRDKASGFCIFDDPAIACHVLRERFDRVAYVDIDVHHGDGVQWIWYDDPSVLTCSIHQDGRTLYPGTGFVEETGAAFSSLNVPVPPRTTGDVWLSAFEFGIMPALEAFQPGAIVLQMGTDTHFMDPLAHVNSTQQDWLAAVEHIRDLSLPIVAVGGGGYNLKTVPRMWVSACLTLAGVPYEDVLPADLAREWDTPTFSDPNPPGPAGSGASQVEGIIDWLQKNHHPNVGH